MITSFAFSKEEVGIDCRIFENYRQEIYGLRKPDEKMPVVAIIN